MIWFEKFKDQFKKLFLVQKFLLGLIILGLVVYGIFYLTSSSAAKPVDCSQVPKAENADVIRMENGQFNPQNLTTKVCNTILFLNLDETAHWPKSQDFDAGHAMAKFDYFQYQVTKTGAYSYNDSLHSEMKGRITVEKFQ